MDKRTDPLSGVAEPYRGLLAEAGHSINGLADRTSIPYTTLRRKLRAPELLTMGDLLLIAEALGVSPASLLPAQFAPAQVA